MALGLVVAAIGLVLAAVAAAQTRAGRLSIGHGTTFALGGAALLAAGLLAGWLAPRHTVLALAAALALALALALAHAAALTRLQERVRTLAQEIALLRGDGPPRTP